MYCYHQLLLIFLLYMHDTPAAAFNSNQQIKLQESSEVNNGTLNKEGKSKDG